MSNTIEGSFEKHRDLREYLFFLSKPLAPVHVIQTFIHRKN